MIGLVCERDVIKANGDSCGVEKRRGHGMPARVLGRARLHRLRKNSDSLGFWEGHDFSRAVKSSKICSRFSARGVLFAPSTTFSAACSAVPPRTNEDAGSSP